MKNESRDSVFREWLVHGAEFEGDYEFPKLKACNKIPNTAIPFTNALRAAKIDQWIHFYTDDYRFERVWNNPHAYLNTFKKFEGIISTDFSVYIDMPLCMQIWNTYRNRALAFWLQNNGIDVIPNVRWGDERTYDFCFDGIPKNSVVAISTNGCIRDKTDRYYFKKGLCKMIEILAPSTIVNYSCMPDDIFQQHIEDGIKFVYIENYNIALRKRGVV